MMEAVQTTSSQIANLELSASDFDSLSKIVGDACGIVLSEGKKGLVKSRLQKRIRLLGLQSYEQYIDLVRSKKGADEMSELVSAISTNVTSFNREAHHFEHFVTKVMPTLVTKMKSGEAARIWSAGCSNGSEPFTIACRMMEAFPTVSKDQFRILATDIDKYSLDTARSAVYANDMISKMEPDLVSRWFEKEAEGYRVSPKLQSLVTFKLLNLIMPWPIKKKYDAIFCRNVMIYFTEDVQIDLFKRFSQHLYPGAFLYIGHSERVIGPASEYFSPVGATTYRFEP